jgi:hypothetical protein
MYSEDDNVPFWSCKINIKNRSSIISIGKYANSETGDISFLSFVT